MSRILIITGAIITIKQPDQPVPEEDAPQAETHEDDASDEEHLQVHDGSLSDRRGGLTNLSRPGLFLALASWVGSTECRWFALSN